MIKRIILISISLIRVLYKNKFMNYRKMSKKSFQLLCWVLALLLVGCSPVRQLEIRESSRVYEALGLHEERKDNFAFYKEAASWLNVPHRDGGVSGAGIDCSGLVWVIYKNVYGKTVERNSSDLFHKNCRRIGKGSLREGDLVFFNSRNGPKTIQKINHVGIYLKNHKFLHASTSRGVIVSSLEEDFYVKVFVCGGRVIR